MGNLCSTPSSTCCKRPWPFPAVRGHARGCKRIKYTLVPQRDPDRQRRKTTALANNHHHQRPSESPNTLHRSNAIRRPGNSRSGSSSPHPPRPTRLEIRNVTPPPYRPSSIAPTLVLAGTPSTTTDPTTSVSASRSSRIAHTNTHTTTTSPTSPTTVISSSYNPSSSSGSAPRDHRRRPQTLYMVDGECVGSDEEHLELRWIDALRAPGAPGGYRTVVDVVEERRSGRLIVVNAAPSRHGDDDGVQQQQQHQQLGPHPSTRGMAMGMGVEEDVNVDGVFAPQSGQGKATFRSVVEEEGRMRGRYRDQLAANENMTPVRRKAVPVPFARTMSGARGGDEESPLAGRSNANANKIQVVKAVDGELGVDGDADGGVGEREKVPVRYRWRRAPMSRPPIPAFRMGKRGVTEKELLDEVEDARRILEGRG
ncbi:MAG: hypothetical protein Q9169_006012, partial [Polycauliona sp. 2 TL-2023]